MDAGVNGFQESQNTPCATFYGAGCALYLDLFTDLTTLGAPPAPPPPPLPPLGNATVGMALLTPTRIFFAMGPSPQMAPWLLAPGESDTEASTPYRRSLQSQDADGEGAEILDASDDPRVIAACSTAEPGNVLSLCETNGYENAVRPASNTRAPYSITLQRRQPPLAPCNCDVPPCAVDHVRPGRNAHAARAAAHPVQVWHPAAGAAAAAAAALAPAAALAAAAAAGTAIAALFAAAALSIPLHRLSRDVGFHVRLLPPTRAPIPQRHMRGWRRGQRLKRVCTEVRLARLSAPLRSDRRLVRRAQRAPD
jgi:hypothetical protein